MKFLVSLLVLLSFSAFADYKSGYDAIGKFWNEEFVNPKNYAPMKPGVPAVPLKVFHERLMKEPKSLKYFLVCANNSRLRQKYKDDKAFGLYLENKFQGKKLTAEQLNKVAEVSGNFILNDKIEAQKAALKNHQTNDAYFERVLQAVEKASFK